MDTRTGWILSILLGVSVLETAQAEVRLPKILGGNMVLQRNQPVPIWGDADPGEPVSVCFAGQEKQTVTDEQGHWMLSLDPMNASAEPREMVISGHNAICLENILVGEVWFCSGQSNMEMATGFKTAGAAPAAQSDPALAEALEGPEDVGIRLFRVEKKIQPPDVVSSGWELSQGEARTHFSAIGYLFALQLQKELGVPVGVIQSAWGGTRIEIWTPPDAYEPLPAFAEEVQHPPLNMDGMAPGRNYAAMVKPLIPFSVRGVLWYQGESNLIDCHDSARYPDKMKALIDSWRAEWKQADLPFLYVQIAPYLYSHRKDKLIHAVTELPLLWEAQVEALAIPDTGMVPTTDLVDNLRNIHPQQKRPIAERLANLALAEVYGKSASKFGAPRFEKMEIRDHDALIHFKSTAGGLKSCDGAPLTHFEIAGPDGRFVPVQATILTDNVIQVSSPEVENPTQVRFGWNEAAQPNLVDANGWPAFPFRTSKDSPRDQSGAAQ